MLKGTATIELTNVKTGEVERYTEKNMVTNAVNDVLTLNPGGIRGYSSMYDDMSTVVPGLIGGILLCENRLDENPDKYWVPEDNPIVGYANTGVNTTAEPKRGSGNQNEQGWTEDGNGYKFVFDFTTAQANGTISAIGLTSGNAGTWGYGSTYSPSSGCSRVKRGCYKQEIHKGTVYSDGKAYWTREDRYVLGGMVDYIPEENKSVSAWCPSQHTVVIRKSVFPVTSRGLRDGVWQLPSKWVHEETTLHTTTFASRNGWAYYGTFVSSGDGYIWGFEHAGDENGNSTGNATVNWIKIKISDLSFTEGTWTLAAQLMPFGAIDFPSDSKKRSDSNAYQMRTYVCILSGFLYCIAYNKKAIYKIELENPSNILMMAKPNGTIPIISSATSSPLSPTYSFDCAINIIGGRVCFGGGYIEDDAIVETYSAPQIVDYAYNYGTPTDPWWAGFGGVPKPGVGVGPYLLGFSLHTEKGSPANLYFTSNLIIADTYLATINNLSKPVQKTADKTMKITYIIREEE